MPDVSGRIKISKDGKYLITTGNCKQNSFKNYIVQNKILFGFLADITRKTCI